MKFNEKLIKLRKENAYSQEDLAEKLNVTRQTISKWESDQSKPDMETLITMSKLFNVSLEELTNDESELNEATKVKNGNKKNTLKTVLIILLVIIGTISIIGFVTMSLFFNKSKEIIKDNGELVYDIFDKMVDKGMEVKEEMDKQDKEKRETFDDAFNNILQKGNELEEKINKQNEQFNNTMNEIQETREQIDENKNNISELYDENQINNMMNSMQNIVKPYVK